MNDTKPEPKIAGRTLAEWTEFAKRDDCLDQMVPSDLRQLLSAILWSQAYSRGVGSQMSDMQREGLVLRSALAQARDQFLVYEGHHRRKIGEVHADDRERKAKVNARFALICQEAIDFNPAPPVAITPLPEDFRTHGPESAVDDEPSSPEAVVKTFDAAVNAGLLPASVMAALAKAEKKESSNVG